MSDPLSDDRLHRRARAILGDNFNTSQLYDETARAIGAAHFPSPPEFNDSVIDTMFVYVEKYEAEMPHLRAAVPMMVAAEAIYTDEGLADLPPPPTAMGIDGGKYRDQILRMRVKLASPGHTLGMMRGSLAMAFLALTKHFPRLAIGTGDTELETTAPLVRIIDLIADLPAAIEDMTQQFFLPVITELNLYEKLRAQLQRNKDAINVRSIRDASPATIVEAYLGGTHLEQVMFSAVPFNITIDDRLEHTAIVAGAGWGKTQLLQSIIAADLQLDDPPAMVIVDSTGAMVQRIQRLAIFTERLKDRLIIIDPTKEAPALNMFDISLSWARATTETEREAIESEVINLFNYVFSSLENPLTAQQATPFAFMVRLLLSMPGANLDTLRELLEDTPKEKYAGALPKFKDAIEKLDRTTRDFFEKQFYSGTSDARRDQIAQRVFALIKVPSFQRMFSGENKVDFFTELNRGSIIVVNTSENLLKESSVTFGRYVIARCLAAAFEREPIPQEQRKPAFLIIDEAAFYFDEQFERLLTRVRQFKLGVVIAFQHLEQASQKLKSAIASSTAVKYGGGVGYADARWFANEMRVEPGFIQNQKRDAARPPQWTQYACHVRNYTDRAVSLTVPFYTLENMPKMTGEEHAALLERNRIRVSAGVTAMTASTTEPNEAPKDDRQMSQPASRSELENASTELAQATTNADLKRIAELENEIIPALKNQTTAPTGKAAATNPDRPMPAAVNPDEPRPTMTSPDGPPPVPRGNDNPDSIEGATEWS